MKNTTGCNRVCKKTHDLDKARFACLLTAAKGKGRTMTAFAVECDTYPSTFTRIMQGANKGASSLELLEAIALHAAPDSGVTFENLAHANGYSVMPSGDPAIPRYLVIEFNSNNPSILSRTVHRSYNAAVDAVKESKGKVLEYLGQAGHWNKPEHTAVNVCPVCGGNLAFTGSSVKGFGEVRRRWICDCCASTGLAIFEDSPGAFYPFKGHESVEVFGAVSKESTQFCNMGLDMEFTYGDAECRYFSAFIVREPLTFKEHLELEARIAQEAVHYDSFVPDANLAEQVLEHLTAMIKGLPNNI